MIVKKHPGRLQLLLLAALFGLPLAAAIVLHVTGWRPAGTTNTGMLIAPPRPLPAVKFITPAATPADWDRSGRKWRLVYLATNGCDDRCRAALAIARQVRLAQGKEQDRVARTLVLLMPPASAHAPVASDPKTEPDLTVLHASAADADTLRAAFQPPVGAAPATGLFVIDPLRNIMMYYPADADPSGMRKDLKRLLQVSQIG